MIVQSLVTSHQAADARPRSFKLGDGTAAQTAEPCSNHIPILSALASTIDSVAHHSCFKKRRSLIYPVRVHNLDILNHVQIGHWIKT